MANAAANEDDFDEGEGVLIDKEAGTIRVQAPPKGPGMPKPPKSVENVVLHVKGGDSGLIVKVKRDGGKGKILKFKQRTPMLCKGDRVRAVEYSKRLVSRLEIEEAGVQVGTKPEGGERVGDKDKDKDRIAEGVGKGKTTANARLVLGTCDLI